MNKYLPSILAVSLLAGGAGVISPVNAATTTSTTSAPTSTTPHQRFGGRGGSFQKGDPTQMKANMLQNEATLLGITTTDLQSRLTAGKTFPQILSDLGITQAQYQAKMQAQMQAQMKTRLDAEVASGKITAAQETQMLTRMQNPPAFKGTGPTGAKTPGGTTGKFDPTQMKASMLQNEATLLGITTTDLQSRVSSGKTFQQIMSDLGITQAQLQAKMQAQLKTKLDALVTSGKITAAQETQMLSRPQNGKGFGFGMRLGGMNANGSQHGPMQHRGQKPATTTATPSSTS